jgi:hypothetical protein
MGLYGLNWPVSEQGPVEGSLSRTKQRPFVNTVLDDETDYLFSY